VFAGDLGAPSLLAVQAGVAAYGWSTTLCNGGDQEAAWVGSSAEHPVSVLALYRLEDGRFEQLGLSWAHHEAAAAGQALCCPCQQATSSQALGVGCSTTSSASIVAAQALFGPRSEVDPWSGVFAYPPGGAPVGGPLDRRLQVRVDDLDPALHPGAQYFAELRAVAADDARAGNQPGGASWRPLAVGAPTGGAFQLVATGPTQRGAAAVEAWPATRPGVTLARAALADDGELCVASSATSADGGLTWTYEYALANLTSARGARRVRVPLAPGASVTALGFHDVHHHSGEPYDTADWTPLVLAGALEWSTATFAQDAHANALRWGTTYNVRFTSDAPPALGHVLLEAFAPGVGAGVLLPALAPAGGLGAPACAGEPNSTGVPGLLVLSGSPVASDLALGVLAEQLPPQQFGYLLASQLAGFTSHPGGSQGNLCLAGGIARFTGAVTSSGPAGRIVVLPDLGAVPTNPPQQVLAGESWTFQLWYRDAHPGPTSNFTEARTLVFQ
jgi:hypothetical protein